jgi:hypothetical protein
MVTYTGLPPEPRFGYGPVQVTGLAADNRPRNLAVLG